MCWGIRRPSWTRPTDFIGAFDVLLPTIVEDPEGNAPRSNGTLLNQGTIFMQPSLPPRFVILRLQLESCTSVSDIGRLCRRCVRNTAAKEASSRVVSAGCHRSSRRHTSRRSSREWSGGSSSGSGDRRGYLPCSLDSASERGPVGGVCERPVPVRQATAVLLHGCLPVRMRPHRVLP